MSSMLRTSLIVSLVLPAIVGSAPLAAQQSMSAGDWDSARAQLVASQPGRMAYAVDRWRQLTAADRFAFSDYANFILSYPGFPKEDTLRRYAEKALDREYVDTGRLIAFFDRYPPLTNPARAQYALALTTTGRPQALAMARAAWRAGMMADTAEAPLYSIYGGQFTFDDHDARMNALLWQGQQTQAERQIARVSPAKRATFMARLAAVQGSDPAAFGLVAGPDARSDPGYLYNRSRQLRRSGQTSGAVAVMSGRPPLSTTPFDAEDWVEELLAVARAGGATDAVRIAAGIDDAFAPGTDVSVLSYGLRDDYTSLMWLGGSKALWDLGQAAQAAPLFYRYGAAARTPPTRSKGFYWAGYAATRAGDTTGATRYFEMAAQYPDQFYGQLSLERLGRPLPAFAPPGPVLATAEQRAAFAQQPLTAAVREVARESDWRTALLFFREISDQAEGEAEHQLVAELARQLGRRDLGVILGQAAAADGLQDFQTIAFPTIPTPPGTNWTMVHAIARQESQFAQNARSHAGAAGLMQLMPGTAREQAGKMGLSYMSASLIDDAGYNLRLGDGYFARMMDYYGGSYPLAVAAYNAGPGNVNKWLRANGDPRSGGVGWVEWIERIPLYETKNYVTRVLENAVVYEAMHPERAGYGGPKSVSAFLGKRTPG